MDPIAIMVKLNGEDAWIVSQAAPDGGYDPSVTYTPGAAVRTKVRGAIGYGPEVVLPEGCTAAFTIECYTMPAVLTKAEDCHLDWAGVDWEIVSFRPRHYRGALNGVTLYLKK